MIGRTFSHYRIVERIGAGGMGEVYKAQDLELARPVALKFLSREMTRNKTFAKRFMREAQAASALEHPNVCTIHEIRETNDGRMFIAMAYYEGKTLQSRISEGPVPLEDAVAYAVAVADGLDLAHKRAIVHRDIKPANIMVTTDGVVKILDFGLAKLVGGSKVSSSGKTLGTLWYMSPEQTQGKDVDHRSDIFSFGVTLYEMITGKSPFHADNEAAVVYSIVNVDPKPMREARAGVPDRLEQIVSRALAKSPDERYQNIGELRDDLLDLLRKIAPSRAVRFESLRRVGARHTRRGVRSALLGVLVAAAAAATAANWSAIRHFLGYGGLGEGPGVAVLPFSAETSDPGAILLADGLSAALGGRVERLVGFDKDLWAVSRDRVAAAAITEPSQASGALGVDAVFTGRVAGTPDGFTLDVSLVDAKSARPIDRLELSTDSEGWHTELNAWVARALRVELDGERFETLTRGDTPVSNAFQMFVLGLGQLASRESFAADSAVTTFDRALVLDSLFTDAHVGRARALLLKHTTAKEKRWADEALASCRSALRLDSSRADAQVVAGQALSAAGESERAVESLARAVALSPRDPSASSTLGKTYRKMGQKAGAEAAYRDAITANPNYFGGYEDLGYQYYTEGKYLQAVAVFERVAALAPDFPRTYNSLGALYFELERWEEATAMFERSFSLRKTYFACSNLGTLYYMDGRFGDAARMYEWAREYPEADCRVVGNLASAYYWIPEERERAMPLFEEAIDLTRQRLSRSPDDAVSLSMLGGYYSVLRPDSAGRYAERAMALDPDNAEVLFRSAAVYEQIGERTRALVLLGDAISRGYSLKIIAHERQFFDLRQDRRYELLIAGTAAETKTR